MTNFLIENDNHIQSGMCLFKAFQNNIFVAGIDFLDKDASIEEYSKWTRDNINNAIDLSKPGYNPQRFPRYNIAVVQSFKYLFQNVKRENNDKFSYRSVRCNFRGLLTRLWNTKGSIYDYSRTVEDYFERRLEEVE